MNILILCAGDTSFDTSDGGYPLCLTEIDGTPLIVKITERCQPIIDKRLIYAFKETDLRRFHLDSLVSLLFNNIAVVSTTGVTMGAACTALLAAEYISNDDDLLILNGNEYSDLNFEMVISDFKSRTLDAGIVTFPSVHPRYSYLKLDADGYVVEAAEKNPISRHATVGFYWFKEGRNFVEATKSMIMKDARVNGLFYICPVFNELILNHERIGVYPIAASQYHPVKNIRQFDDTLRQMNSN
jgi:NDP-sugar pyrophosphorylase family protein